MQCGVCGGTSFTSHRVLPPELIRDWELSPEEAAYIDRQQAENCDSCGSNLRSIALANAIRAHWRTAAVLKEALNLPRARQTRLLEINEAGMLSPILRQHAGYTFAAYPEVDIHAMPYADASFDLVVHSDTLEHVEHPVKALSECRRVLRPGGALCFTVPTIVGRMTRSRRGLPKSYHGDPALMAEDYVVHTEFGADVWTQLMEAGFTDVSIHSVGYPAGIAWAARQGWPTQAEPQKSWLVRLLGR